MSVFNDFNPKKNQTGSKKIDCETNEIPFKFTLREHMSLNAVQAWFAPGDRIRYTPSVLSYSNFINSTSKPSFNYLSNSFGN